MYDLDPPFQAHGCMFFVTNCQFVLGWLKIKKNDYFFSLKSFPSLPFDLFLAFPLVIQPELVNMLS
jgi:hypothetical protein